MEKTSLGMPVPVGIIDPIEGKISTDTSSNVGTSIFKAEASVPTVETPIATDGSGGPPSFPKLWVDTMMAPLSFWTSVMAAFLHSLDQSRPAPYAGATDR